jgi:hypothetical protein
LNNPRSKFAQMTANWLFAGKLDLATNGDGYAIVARFPNALSTSLRAQRSNPGANKKDWIASSQELLVLARSAIMDLFPEGTTRFGWPPEAGRRSSDRLLLSHKGCLRAGSRSASSSDPDG